MIILGFSITQVAFAGISLITMQPAPILALSPIVTGPIILAPAPIKTLLPILGAPYLPPPYFYIC